MAASAIHRRTRHRVTSALAYAVLEWILIALLLVDGLFAYAIARFADHFGLRPPCLLCSRLDRLFQAEDGEGARWLRGVLCGAHAAEISGVGYCLRHRRLAHAADMCDGCLPSSSREKQRRNGAGEKGAAVCSCCEAAVEASSREEIHPEDDQLVPVVALDEMTVAGRHRDSGEEDDLDIGLVSEGGNRSSEVGINCDNEAGAVEPSTIDQLKSMYAELEEERSAAAVATNQTMAMINRLQEEKAAVQMEALQYQRMMEEQSEYDQQAMQLLTELVTKRERELELCRQQLRHHEDRERRRTASFKDTVHSPNGSSSSGDDDTDEHSDDTDEHSLTYFEMERLSILDELKALEERLFTLEDDGDTNAGAGHSPDDHDLRSPANGLAGDDNPKRAQGRINPTRKGKSLLPLFDAAVSDHPDGADESTTTPAAVFPEERERAAIIEEVDHVYERLQALEADKEFLRHCIKSLKKGEKGMHLLQEILQHLRELRSVDQIHVRNAGDAAIAASSA